ncbi:DUF771 domain-containing protein [Streptococcus suis]|uniref:DUF771 domain-containing protein n=1 Tax=Streptococcus suis TaxID=1307 RepID=A0A0Z8ME84_STRSU|nr:DUF771 domain-containing protein [Streptococcus suis]MBY4967298.1 DUF771 domain-containing protein [Streptococcus suis]MDW8709690.1 DUF771 domain-containing protein [Streptococcus suis]NQG66422.1 DUF771 domain-containing protein [Streptococcus suis]NQG68441.1 DUF771 domain-containing protein [Streptococcus suis]NQH52574.1 DUF771 domain-containing protein [Streptococcus suis]
MRINEINLEFSEITVKLPEGYAIHSEAEYQELQKKASIGHYMTLNDVLEMLSVSRPWLLENVLYKPIIRKQIDIDQNPNGFVKYPQNRGGRYFFLATKTREFFEQNFLEIFK